MIYIKAEALAGDVIDDVIHQAIKLADRMQVPVELSFNGVTVFAKPMADPSTLIANWHREFMSNKKHKFATTSD